MSMQLDPAVQSDRDANLLAPPNWQGRYAQFGNFVVDLKREELYQGGRRLKVQGKVCQTLLVLLSHAGEIVTREEVRKRLWPEAFLVNLDANVNTAMNKLRQVLGDSPDQPVYIETIPRRGYCFIAPVEFSDAANLLPAKSNGSRATAAASAAPAHARNLLQYLLPATWRMVSLVLAGMLVGALLVLFWFFVYNKSHRVANSRETASHSAAELRQQRR
jgi:DNA-binding winged helix-turn-helix (wHTH) protein